MIYEYLDMFLKEGLPFLIHQSFETLRSWPFVVLVIFLFSKKPLMHFVSKIQGIRFSNTEIVTQGNEIGDEGLKLDQTTLPPLNRQGNGIGDEGLELDTGKLKKEGLSSKKGVPLFEIQEGVFKHVWLYQEEVVKKELENSPFEKEAFLIRELASCQIALNYERIYKGIFKSQFDTLQMILNTHPDGVLAEEIKKFYERAKSDYPVSYSNYSFENWLNFLTSYDLILLKDNKWYATEKSRAFIFYIIGQQKYNIQEKIF